MSGLIIQLHRAFGYENKRVIYRGRARDPERSFLFEDADRIQVRLTEQEVLRLRSENRLTDWLHKAASVPDGPATRMHRVTIDLASEAERISALRQQDYCLAWAQRPDTPRSAAGLVPLIADVHAQRMARASVDGVFEPPPPCASSLQNWLRRWLNGGRTQDALIPQDRMKGNRGDKLRGSAREFILSGLDEHYLTRQRLSVAEVHRRMAATVKSLNCSLRPGEKLSIPTYESIRKATEKLCPFVVDYCRLGPAVAKERWRAIGSGILTSRANEVWEIDDTRADLICCGVDGTTVIGRPWLVVVIDRHTRMIMGYVITFTAPDTTTAMEALKVAMLPKDDWLRRQGVSGHYPAQGKPEAVHVDKGKHYNSRALTRGLLALGINHRTMPLLHAWYKGTVERAIGTISRRVFHTVPGTTYSSIYERDEETAPETVAECTLDELRTKMTRWLVEEYQHTHHKGVDHKPYAMWMRSLATQGWEMPPTRDAIESALSHTVARAGRKDGLQFNYLKYHSEELLEVLMLPKAVRSNELIIRVDRENLEVVQFLHPVTGTWLPAYLRKDMLPRVQGRSLEEYEMAQALRRNRPDEFGDNDADYLETYAEVGRAMRQQDVNGKLGERVKGEGARERALRTAAHITKPDAHAAPAPGEDLASLVDRAAGHVPPATTAVTQPSPPASAAAPVDPADFAARLGLGVRVTPKRDGD